MYPFCRESRVLSEDHRSELQVGNSPQGPQVLPQSHKCIARSRLSSCSYASALERPFFQGYRFFRADPLPGQIATWEKVERTEMQFRQSELYKMVAKRADRSSSAQQYKCLPDAHRLQVDQLIHEHLRKDFSLDWSCVYAKQRYKHRESLEVILMARPKGTNSHQRTPLGDFVVIGVPEQPMSGQNPRKALSLSHQKRLQSVLDRAAGAEKLSSKVPSPLIPNKSGPRGVVSHNAFAEYDIGCTTEEAPSDDQDESPSLGRSGFRPGKATTRAGDVDEPHQKSSSDDVRSTPPQVLPQTSRNNPGSWQHPYRRQSGHNSRWETRQQLSAMRKHQ